MSYYHTTQKATKAEAKADLMAQFDNVTVSAMPVHSKDRAAVEANLDATLSTVADDPTKDVSASINGSASYIPGDAPGAEVITSLGISASVSLVTRKAAATA